MKYSVIAPCDVMISILIPHQGITPQGVRLEKGQVIIPGEMTDILEGWADPALWPGELDRLKNEGLIQPIE